ncbi:unnamed protein product [Leptidea sinapis]|uniref:Uncharacterized protein n=1 Tax=Leptidea sinapis TaxID=189913 RepID=A0A5E4R238_9NEOP|nr:unnamed protein product [Leptidea sinapis]
MPSICTTTTFATYINIFLALNNNKWLNILCNDTQCVLKYEKELSHHKLQEAGILTLPHRCKLHTGYYTLSAFHSTEENIISPTIIPDTRTEDCFEEMKNLKTPTLLPISIGRAKEKSTENIIIIGDFNAKIEKLYKHESTDKEKLTIQQLYDILEKSLTESIIESQVSKPKETFTLSDNIKSLISRRHTLQQKSDRTIEEKIELKELYRIIPRIIQDDYDNYKLKRYEKCIEQTSGIKRIHKKLHNNKSWIPKFKTLQATTEDRKDLDEDAVTVATTAFLPLFAGTESLYGDSVAYDDCGFLEVLFSTDAFCVRLMPIIPTTTDWKMIENGFREQWNSMVVWSNRRQTCRH